MTRLSETNKSLLFIIGSVGVLVLLLAVFGGEELLRLIAEYLRMTPIPTPDKISL